MKAYRLVMIMMQRVRKIRTRSIALALVTNSLMLVNVQGATPVGDGITIAVSGFTVFLKKANNGTAISAVIVILSNIAELLVVISSSIF